MFYVLGLENIKIARIILRASYIVAIGFIMISFSRLFIAGIIRFMPESAIIPGPLYVVYIIYFVFIYSYASIKLLWRYRESSGYFKMQLKYIGLAFAFATVSGFIHFLSAFKIKEIFPHDILIAIYSLIMAYAIIRYRLMDINRALIRAGIFTIVYIIVLGIPVWIGIEGRPFLSERLGVNWWILPSLLLGAMATIGPFLYLYLQRRAEDVLLKDQRRYQTALRELSRRMTRIRNIDELLKAIATTIVDTGKISYITIYLKDDEYKSYRVRFSHPKENHSHFKELLPLNHPIIEILYQQRKPVLSEEVTTINKEDLYFSLIVPCFMENDLLAFIALGTKPNNHIYTQDDIMVFEMLSYSTALAIENSIFWEEIQERQRKERVKEMDIYAYSLAHEIDNPMQVIMGSYYNLKPKIENSELTEEAKKSMIRSLEFMSEAAIRVTGMVEAIRSFGSRTSGELNPLEIKDVVESFIRLYTPQLKAEKIILAKEMPQESIYIRGEKNELITILINFAKNAIHAMKSSSEKRIVIKAMRTNSDFVKICFSDTGYGIPKEKILTIFAPFVTTKASTVGTGMGLYNVVRMARHNKGKVWAESEGENKGATLVLELPIAKDVKKEDLLEKEDKRARWKF